jgi:pantoate--beta-alanine ligase
MQIVRSIETMRSRAKAVTRGSEARTLGLVPTMGALHDGHLSLVRAARAACDGVAVSIFVNPLQFGSNEDLAGYPRTFDDDCALLEREGVDLLFAPTPETVYPTRSAAELETWVDVPGIGGRLDGVSRPGHFRAVATVVAKLFHIVQPDRAYFGQKDAAQVAVLRTMVRDLNFDVEIVVCPTVRDSDGLALSSRNRNLSARQREQALAIPRALQHVAEAVRKGCAGTPHLRSALLQELKAAEGIRVDYAEVVDAQTLEPVDDLREGALVAVAAWAGETRLIDNILLAPVKVAEQTKAAQ